MHSLVEQVLKRFDDTPVDHEQETPTAPASPGSEAPTLMLSPHDITGLLHALIPSCSGLKTSTSPSTAGSSTLTSDTIYNEGSKLTTPSLSEMSSTSAEAFVSGRTHAWETDAQSSSKIGDTDSDSAADRKRLSYVDLEHRLGTIYNSLTSILQTESAPETDPTSIQWAFFATDPEGKVLSLRAKSNSAMDIPGAHGEYDYMNGGAKEPASEIQTCIVQLLSQKNPHNVAWRSLPPPNDSHTEDVKSILSSLIGVATDQAMAEYDYPGIRYWWQMQQNIESLEGPADDLLWSTSRRCQENLEIHRTVARGIEKQLYTMSHSREKQADQLRLDQAKRKALRMKMWYASGVRHSSTFEDALHVTQALRAMCNTTRSKQGSGVANWARQRLRNASWQDRSVTQTVEALTEPSDYSGTCKLNDDQVERTSRWLTRQSVENFCRGEERVQRFCFEVQKCATKLTGLTLLESPVLWSSRLFEQEKRSFDRKSSSLHSQPFQTSMRSISSPLNQYPPTAWRQPQHGVPSIPMDTSKSNPVVHDSTPKEPVRSLPLHTSPTSFMPPGAALPSHLSSLGIRQGNQATKVDAAKTVFTAEIKRSLCSLILSDLGYLLWHSGTETDNWVKLSSLDDSLDLPDHQSEGQEATGKPDIKPNTEVSPTSSRDQNELRSLLLAASSTFQDSKSRWQLSTPINNETTIDDGAMNETYQSRTPSFPYSQNYKGILQRFSMSQDPHYKLRMLHELEHLVSYSIQDSIEASAARNYLRFNTNSISGPSRTQSLLVPRTKATSFEEVIANCTERRAGTLKFNRRSKSPPLTPANEIFGTDEIVNTFLLIFRDLDLRPSTLFRDLQYIAAFVPAEILDQTPQGKAFWDAGLAALALKQELCDAMVTRATDITNYHISASSSSPNPPTPSFHDQNLAHTTLQDAAHLWIIAAKEGSATAARELGLLYLTHPEILPRTTLQPFSKPKEVFRMVGARREGSMAVVEEGRLDPVTFAVVFHWMEVAANGGDRDARDFLRGNGDWNSGR
ncbi:MAG: hypothetical protein Q9170_005284 [Blastenia crenularia]